MLPIQLDVSSNIMSQVNTINEKTSFFGLEFEPFGNDQLIVREIPLWFQDVHEEAFLYDLLDFFEKDNETGGIDMNRYIIMAKKLADRFEKETL